MQSNAQGDELAAASGFALPEARGLVREHFAPNPIFFWPDLIVTGAIAYGSAYLYLSAPAFSWLGIAAFVVAGFAVFRIATFIHEIVHLRRGTLPGFVAAWNVLIGVPMMTPSYFYENHNDHHNRKHYGTPQDGEYLPLAQSPLREIVLYFAQVPIIPLLAVIRFVVITPLTYVSPALRRWVDRCASSYISNPYYKRPSDTPPPAFIWRVAEFAVFALYAGLIALMIADVISWTIAVKLYVLACFAIMLNWIRNLAGHTFTNTGDPISHVAQFEDSITVDGNPVVCELMFPLGLRYHALHHLFPAMPYHELGKAHRKLMAQLSPASREAYLRTVSPGLGAVLLRLCRAARASSDRAPMALWRKGPQQA
ncbi:MAG TPA: fatty acid desaturase [Rhizomicrobium sp.]|nr:fatty acid desaturase [Rhizomicrobium sp.]